MRLGRCSRGHVGLVTDRKWIRYSDGSRQLAYVGRHILPIRLIGRRWSSRNPDWL